jgi:hypothetical protein
MVCTPVQDHELSDQVPKGFEVSFFQLEFSGSHPDPEEHPDKVLHGEFHQLDRLE